MLEGVMNTLQAITRSSLIKVCSTGAFSASLDGDEVFFQDGSGSRLTTHSVPSGSWPIAYIETGDDRFLYFTYFLSTMLHKWRLDPQHQRVHGSGASLEEVQALLSPPHGADAGRHPEHGFIYAKLKGQIDLREEAPAVTQCTLMNALDRSVARLVVDGNLNPLSLADQIARLAFEVHLPYEDVANLLRVPTGYALPLMVMSEHGTVEVSAADLTAEIDQSSLSDFTAKMHRIWGQRGIYYCRPLQLAGFHPMEAETVQIRLRRDAPAGTPTRVQELWLSPRLIGPSRNPGHLRRILDSQEALHPFLATALDRMIPDGTLNFCFADGGAADRHTISFDRRLGSPSPLIPDLYVLIESRHQNYFPTLRFEEFEPTFRAKNRGLFWRGTTTGHIDGNNLAGLKQNYRVQACLLIRAVFGALGDAKVTALDGLHPDEHGAARDYLQEQGIWDARQPEERFAGYQLYLDLRGNAAAWYTFRKYLMGCLVIRPHSDRELLYYRYQQPWLHFIPAAEDLSDLGTIIDWIDNHQREAAMIAYTGRRMMIEYLASVRRHVCHAVEAAFAPASVHG